MTAPITREQLRALYGEPSTLALAKDIHRLDRHCRDFIARSPFLLIATAGADGLCDVSPKGDPPGFVKVLDDARLAIPDRPGNRRLDTMENLLDNPGIGLIFLVPGIDETLRVNGTAEIRDDPALNAALAVNGRPALLAIVVTVREAYLHCGKALMRARLWSDDHKVPRAEMPTLGRMIRDQTGTTDIDTAQEAVVRLYQKTLY